MRGTVAMFAAILACGAQADEPSRRVEEVTYQYPEPDAMEFYRHVLDAMKISYRTETYEGKLVHWWRPVNEAQDAEVRGRVSQYRFATRSCPKSYWPPPTMPAGTITRCAK